MFVGTPIMTGSLLRLFVSNERSSLDMNMHGRRPFRNLLMEQFRERLMWLRLCLVLGLLSKNLP